MKPNTALALFLVAVAVIAMWGVSEGKGQVAQANGLGSASPVMSPPAGI